MSSGEGRELEKVKKLRKRSKGDREKSREIWGQFIGTKEAGCVKQGMPDHPLAASFACSLAV